MKNHLDRTLEKLFIEDGGLNQWQIIRQRILEKLFIEDGGLNPPYASDSQTPVPICPETQTLLTKNEIEKNGLDPNCYVFVNEKGERAIERIFWNPGKFYCGLAKTWLHPNDETQVFINEKGEKAFDLDFIDASNFIDGTALVRLDGGSLLTINFKGEIMDKFN